MKKIIFLILCLVLLSNQGFCQTKDQISKDLFILRETANSIEKQLQSARAVTQADVTTIPVYENKWEYQIKNMSIQSISVDVLNSFGEEGWEIMAIQLGKDNFPILYMKRKKRVERYSFE